MNAQTDFSHGGSSSRAFTLVELLVVISIVAVLIAMLLPAIGKARAQVFITVCLSNMRQIGIGERSYQNENKEYGPVFTDAPFASTPIYGSYMPNTAAASGVSRSSLGLIWDGKYLASSRVMYCPPELAWSVANGWSDPAHFQSGASSYNFTESREWNHPALANARLNSSYLYRWGCPNPHSSVTPYFPNFQQYDGQIYAMTFTRDGKNNDMGIMIDNVMDLGYSPATATGTVHPNGGNALYADLHAKFLRTLNNPFNPGSGPYGYYLGELVFMDVVDHK